MSSGCATLSSLADLGAGPLRWLLTKALRPARWNLTSAGEHGPDETVHRRAARACRGSGVRTCPRGRQDAVSRPHLQRVVSQRQGRIDLPALLLSRARSSTFPPMSRSTRVSATTSGSPCRRRSIAGTGRRSRVRLVAVPAPGPRRRAAPWATRRARRRSRPTQLPTPQIPARCRRRRPPRRFMWSPRRRRAPLRAGCRCP